MKVAAIITAGGKGTRMGRAKQFLPILGRPMVEWTVEAFKGVKEIGMIILVAGKEDMETAKKLGVEIVEGGEERTDSVRNGLSLVPDDTDIVLVHDGARPMVTKEVIEAAIRGAADTGAVVVGVPVKDTIKMTNGKLQTANGCSIIKTIDREDLWQAQTPQAFRFSIIREAYAKAEGSSTDDSKLVEDLGISVRMVMGSYENIKVTAPGDLMIAEAVLRNRDADTR